MKKSKRIATVEHILSNFWSPFYAYYMSFQSLGSQKSITSNGEQIRVEMKKLWTLEDIHTKLKGNFASCEINIFLRNQPFRAKSTFSCEMYTFSLRNFCRPCCKLRNQPFRAKWRLSTCEIFAAHVACYEIHLSASRYLPPTLLDFFFKYLLFKSPFSPYNPLIIGFLS